MAIRILFTPVDPVLSYWVAAPPCSLHEWLHDLERLHLAVGVSGETGIPVPENTALRPLPPADLLTPPFVERTAALFFDNQRLRWNFRRFLNTWRWRRWCRSPHCGVDLIMNEPVEPQHTVYLTDTSRRAVYAFHYRDLFTNLLARITAAEEMLPTPRPPTNPWTNEPLTLAQTIAVCQSLLQHYATRGICPPTLFAAFWQARFDLARFESENTALLSQSAINNYFKDIHDHNREAVIDSAVELLHESGTRFTSLSFRRWMRQTPPTLLHYEWLSLVRDYTLYMNLHVQARRHWYSEDNIHRDVRALYRRTPVHEALSQRIRLIQGSTTNTAGAPASGISMAVVHLTAEALGNGSIPLTSATATYTFPVGALAASNRMMDVSGDAPGNMSGGDVSGSDVSGGDVSGGDTVPLTDAEMVSAALLMLLRQSFQAE